MSKNDLVSVIVPIYNREKLMIKCIDSILNQTYKNIEILLIDDASTDNSYKVMKEYNNKYSNVRIFTYKENKGPGYARNVGIENSKGDYIIFIDSDDYIDNDYVETLINNIGDADMVCCGHVVLNKNNKKVIHFLHKNSLAPFSGGIVTSKMYTTSSVKQNNIKFSNMKYSEDTRFNFEYLVNTSNVVCLNDYFGYIVIKTGGSLSSCGEHNSSRYCNMYLNMEEVLRKSIENNRYKEEFYYLIISELIYSTWCVSKDSKFDNVIIEYKKMLEFMNGAFDKNNIKIHFVKCSTSLIDYLFVNSFILFYKLKLDKLFIKMLCGINKFLRKIKR